MDRQAEGHRSGAHPRSVGAVHRFGAATRTGVRVALGSSRRVPEAGLEPARPFGQWILNPSRLPDYATRACQRRVAKCGRRGSGVRPELVRAGWNDCEIARETGIPRGTVRDWRSGRIPDFDGANAYLSRMPVAVSSAAATFEPAAGRLYVSPGALPRRRVHVHRLPREVYKLRIACAERYPELIRHVRARWRRSCRTRSAGRRKIGCWEVASFSKHWPCLFPQHGPGKKHERRIELTPWQQELVDRDPRPLIRGLLHSDGCRVLNWVNGTPYPALPLQQRVGRHPGDLRAGVRPAGDRVAAEQPVQPVGGQAGECRPAGRVRGAQTVRAGRSE